MKVYLSGPMTGIPQYNFPAFIKAAKVLRALGHEVLSPVELDADEQFHAAFEDETGTFDDSKWADYLARDIAAIGEFKPDAIVVLDGWEQSRGACLETLLGYKYGMKVFSYTDMLQDEEQLPNLEITVHDLAWAWRQ